MGSSKRSLSSLNGLSEKELEAVAGGVATWSVGRDSAKTDQEMGEDCRGLGDDALPETETPHGMGASADASASGTDAHASAKAEAGWSETQDLGNGVSVTVYAGAGAAAEAKASLTGASAGAKVYGGFGERYDLGKGVEINAECKGFAGVGVGAGIIDNNLALGGSASAGFSSSVSQKFTSVEFGDGAKVEEHASVEAGGQASAGGGTQIGAGGVHSGYGTEAGLTLKAELGAEVGNDEYSGGVTGRGYAPGSVGAGASFSAGYEDGQLKLSLSNDIQAFFGGYGFDVELDVQLWETTTTKGSAEEIQAALVELSDYMASQEDQMTDTWRGSLQDGIHSVEGAIHSLESDQQADQQRYDSMMHEKGLLESDLANELALQENGQPNRAEQLQHYLDEYSEGGRAHELEELETRLSVRGEQLEYQNGLLADLQDEYHTAQLGDQENIDRIEHALVNAQTEYDTFVSEHEREFILTQDILGRFQEDWEKLAVNVAALELRSGAASSVTGSEEFAAAVTARLEELQGMNSEFAGEVLVQARDEMAYLEAKLDAEVPKLQEKLQTLGAEYLEHREKLETLSTELNEANSSTFRAVASECWSAVQPENEAVLALELDAKVLKEELAPLEREAQDLAEHIANDEAALSHEKANMESNMSREVDHLRAMVAERPDPYFSHQLELFDKVQGQDGREARQTLSEIRDPLLLRWAEESLHMAEAETRLADDKARLNTLETSIGEKTGRLGQVEDNLVEAKERLETAKATAFADHPEYSSQLRAQEARERLDDLKSKVDQATGMERDMLQQQLRTQERLCMDLDRSAKVSSDKLEYTQEQFYKKVGELQSEYEDLKTLVVKKGVFGEIASVF